MKKIILFLAMLAATGVVSVAQLRWPVVGTYKKLSAQGMTILGDDAYIFNDTGLCRVYNLKEETVTREFFLGSTSETTHGNSVCFGSEIPKGGEFPALYVGEWTGEGRLFVENVLPDRSEWIQTIKAVENGEDLRMLTWAVDAENGFLYGVSRGERKVNEAGAYRNTVHKYRLPRLDEGREILLTENDVLDSFSFDFANILQGSKIRDGYMYIVTGNSELRSGAKNKRAIKVIDLKTKRLTEVDLTDVVVNEPEDIDFYNGAVLLFCGGNGGIYQVQLK